MMDAEEKTALDEDRPGSGAAPAAESGDNLFQRIKRLSMGEKTKLALTGDKECRTLLLRENNKLLCQMVLKNPRITVEEVMELAKSRGTASDAIQMIAQNREWMKSYPLKLALTTNPKTPLPLALRLVRSLMTADLRRLAKSKDVPQVVSTEARKIVAFKGAA
ncbi:MAG: hypothetical protein K8I02_08970 [Candidatus Methylomirabilis sp.]|nr:hypothetical protein [Deltaproteobacteria bacterium]